MRILVSTALLSPYRVDWLDELGKYADIDILCLEDTNKERNKQWLEKKPKNARYEIIRGFSFPKIGKLSFSVIRKIKNDSYDIIILDGYGFTNQIINMVYLNRKKINYFVNVDGIIPKEENQLVRFVKHKLLSKVPYFICGSFATNQVLKGYGVSKKKIINHSFTSLFEQDICKDIISKEEKEQLKMKLGIKEKIIVISVGRFSYLSGYGKGYDAVIKAAKSMSDDFGWYIIGGEPTDEFKHIIEDAKLNNVHFVKHLDKEALKGYYRAADVFVLMTVGDVWGLVINEAMACGLPIVTTDKCMAGLDLVEDDSNGYIVHVGDSEGLKESIEKIIMKNHDGSMSLKSLEKIKPYTIENMANTHIEVFNKIICRDL